MAIAGIDDDKYFLDFDAELRQERLERFGGLTRAPNCDRPNCEVAGLFCLPDETTGVRSWVCLEHWKETKHYAENLG